MTQSLAFYISVLRKQFTQYCFQKLADRNITHGQLFIIIFVEKKGPCSPKEISLALRLDAGFLTRSLSKLIANGFLAQTKNEKDRRANIITLTPAGRQIFEQSRRLFYDWDEAVSAHLTDSEKSQLIYLLQKIAVQPQKEMEE